MMLKRFIFLALVQVAFAGNRLVIDKRSCVGAVYDQVKLYADAAIKRAELVADVLRPYIEDPNNKPDDRILKQAKRLFGNDDVATAGTLFAHYDAIRKYVWVDVDNWSTEWKKDRDQFDLQIHCDASHIVPWTGVTEPNVHWEDSVQDTPVEDGAAILDFKDADTTTQGVTSPGKGKPGEPWQPGSPEVITFKQNYFDTAIEQNAIFDLDHIKKAARTDALARVKMILFLRFRKPAQVDILDTPDFVLLHELTHTVVGGDASDTDGDNSYGWLNCVRLKDIGNAESLAFFALTVDLIQNYGYDVDDKGKLKKF